MRLFLSIGLPDSAKAVVSRAGADIERGAPGFFKWTDPAQMHLTLYFLGEMESVDEIVRSCSAIEAPSFELSVGGLVVLPEPSLPRVLAAGLGSDVAALKRLQQRISDTVFPLAEHKETRGFAPHVTFGRLKRGMPGYAKALKKALAEARVDDSDAFAVDGFDLVESRLGDGGPKYETLHRFALR